MSLRDTARAMSQQNVERLRQGFDAFFRRDRQSWLALCDPDFESVPSDDWPELEPIRGAEAAWDFYVETDEPWELDTPTSTSTSSMPEATRSSGRCAARCAGKPAGPPLLIATGLW